MSRGLVVLLAAFELFDPGRTKILGGVWDYLKENKDYPYYLVRDRFAGTSQRALRTITRSVAGGVGSLRLVKRFGATRLQPGAYRLIVTAAADASAQPSPPRAVSFKVVRRAR